MLRIDLRSRDAGYHSITLEPSPEEVGLEPKDLREILVDVRMDYDGKKALLNLTASAVASLVCDRTLVEFEQGIRGEYTVLYTTAEGDEAVDEVRRLAASDEEIDITEIVRDTLLLAIPVRKLAPGAEEADIPVAFGQPAEEDIDPRWEALKALKNDNGDT